MIVPLLSANGRLLSLGATVILVSGAALLGLGMTRSAHRVLRAFGILSGLLGAVAAAITIGVAVLAADDRLLAILFVFGLLMLPLGLVESILQLRVRRRIAKPQERLPFGALLIGIGLFISLNSLIIPIIPGQLGPIERLPPSATPTATATYTAAPTRTPPQSATPTLAPTLTFTPTPLPTLTETPGASPSVEPTQTSGSTAQVGATAASTSSTRAATTAQSTAQGCQIEVNRNVNLRSDPRADSQLLVTIPYNTLLVGLAQVKGWWQVRYQDQMGWVTKDATTGGAECRALPVAATPTP